MVQAYQKNTAEYLFAQEWNSGTPQIHSPVEVDGQRCDTARLFNSQAYFDKPPPIFDVWSHSRPTS